MSSMEEHESGLLTECCDLLNTISNYPENKKCFDCRDNYSPRYLCTTFSTFVCSCCANIHHKEFGHSIKVLSVFSFTFSEIYVLKETGNRVATDKWLARWRSDLYMEPDPTSPTYKEDARKYMKAKYIEKRWVKVPPALPLLPGVKRDETDEPRGYDDVSPRKVLPDCAVPADREPSVAQQHDDKSVTQSPLRESYGAPVMYIPQPMYIPVSQMPMAVGPYGYQYMPQPVDASKMQHQQPHYGQLYPYPYDNMHCFPPPIMAEGISWPVTKKQQNRPAAPMRAPQQLTSSEELPVGPPGAIFRSVSDNSLLGWRMAPLHSLEELPQGAAIFRSVSDNSIVTHYIVQAPSLQREPSNSFLEYIPSVHDPKQQNIGDSVSSISVSLETKPQTTTPQTPKVSSSGDSKLNTPTKKLTGIMNKVAGFLGKK